MALHRFLSSLLFLPPPLNEINFISLILILVNFEPSFQGNTMKNSKIRLIEYIIHDYYTRGNAFEMLESEAVKIRFLNEKL